MANKDKENIQNEIENTLEVANCDLKEVTHIENRILTIRGVQVMLDRDLAELYGTETKFLNLAVKRNKERFPSSFMFQLTQEEFSSLRLQIVTSKSKGGRRYLPYAFSKMNEHAETLLRRIE